MCIRDSESLWRNEMQKAEARAFDKAYKLGWTESKAVVAITTAPAQAAPTGVAALTAAPKGVAAAAAVVRTLPAIPKLNLPLMTSSKSSTVVITEAHDGADGDGGGGDGGEPERGPPAPRDPGRRLGSGDTPPPSDHGDDSDDGKKKKKKKKKRKKKKKHGDDSSPSPSDSSSSSRGSSTSGDSRRKKKKKESGKSADEVKVGQLPKLAQYDAWRNTLFQNVDAASLRKDSKALDWIQEVEDLDVPFPRPLPLPAAPRPCSRPPTISSIIRPRSPRTLYYRVLPMIFFNLTCR